MFKINFSCKKNNLPRLSPIVLLVAIVLNASAAIASSASAFSGNEAPEKNAAFGTSSLNSIIGDVFLDRAFFAFDDAVFVVNNSGDTNDVLAGDGICADAAGNCTLRAALQEANTTAAVDQINFNLTAPATIQLNQNLTPASLTISQAVSINGPGADSLTISGNVNTLSGVFNITHTAATTTTISGVTITGSGRDGINNEAQLNLSEVVLRGNRYGIYGGGRLTTSRVRIHNNSGGGIYVNSSPAVSITNSIINDNAGSGVYLAAGSAAVNISNTTITNNTSANSGGGIHALSGDLTLNNVTVSHNTATINGGGIYYNATAAGVFVRNTLIANNNAAVGPDIATGGGNFTSRGNNLIGKNAATNIGFVNGVNGDKVGTIATPLDPLLGPLQNNGGDILTRALLVGSPALNAGNVCVTTATCVSNNPASALSTDQRGTGFPRLFEASVDIGAFEAFYPLPSITSLSPSNWGTGRGAFELTVNGTNFVANSVVRWNGQNRVTTFVSNTQIKAQILATDVATAGQFAVTVFNILPGGGLSNAVNFTVADCAYSINPASRDFAAAGGSGNFNLTTPFGCAWAANVVSPANSWITINGSNSGAGPATITFTVAANTGPARSGTITVAGQTFTVNQASGCTYSISPTGTTIGANGGPGSFTVTTNAGCPWTASANVSWITFNNASGTGTGSVTFTVAPNTGPQRTGNIAVGGQTFTVTQNNGCTYALSPTAATIAAAGGASSFNVNTGAGCTWSITSSIPTWITINSGSSGTGPGAVNFTVAANNGPARSATITVNGQTFTVNQNDGCTYSISPTSQSFTNAAGSGSIAVTTVAGCTWTAVASSGNPPWITVTSGSPGNGSGTVNFTVAANTGPARNGSIVIGGQTFSVTQATGCTYAISPTSVSISDAGGSRTVGVTVNNQLCGWSANVNNASWITFSGANAGTGNGTMTLAIAANAGSTDRSGTVTISGQTFTVNQLNLKVTNLSDGGAGSLRQAIANANAISSDDTVAVSTSLAGTLALTSGEIVVANNGALEIKGSGADRLIISGGNTSRIFYFNNANVTLSDVALMNGNGVGTDSTTTNKAGGAIYVNSGTLKANRVLIAGNTMNVPGGLGNSSNGGGIYFAGGTNHLIQNSTFFNNKCLVGGGFFNLNGSLTIVNSTLSNNIADAEGGAIYNGGNTTIRNSTLTRNRTLAGSDSGAGVTSWGSAINFSNSIIAGNFGPEISIRLGEVSSSGYNLIGDEAGDAANTTNVILYQPSDKLDMPPLLGVIDIYGGGTATHALLRGSPAINSGNNANALPTDQRGSARIVGETIDIGAYEYHIDVMPETLPAATVGTYYSHMLSASRVVNPNPSETFTFTVTEGMLPEGVTLSSQGLLQGTPTSTNTATFTVKAVSNEPDAMAGAVKYTISLGCTYLLNPTSQPPFSAAGGNGNFFVGVASGCSWTATSSAPAWMRVTGGASGSGNGTVQFVVDPNTGPARGATIVVAGQTFNVSQATGCAYSLSPNSANIQASGGTGIFNMNVGAGCTWAAVSNDSWITVASGSSGSGNGTISYSVAANAGAQRTGIISAGGRSFAITQSGATGTPRTAYDFDGDGKADYAVFRPSNGYWYILNSTNGSLTARPFGTNGDLIAPADFDGDGKTDISVFRPGANSFYRMNSANDTFTAVYFGTVGDVPVAADYDGDGKGDVAVYRASAGSWYRLNSSDGQFVANQFGSAEDKPIVGNFDGDTKADLTVFRPSNGYWYRLNSSNGQFVPTLFGTAEDKPAAADFDGDGRTDIAVFRPSNRYWYILNSSNGAFTATLFGASQDKPVPADFDGDGKADIAVFRDGTWYVLKSRDGFVGIAFGAAGDKPIHGAYVP